jgi:hypothetical protein
MQGWNEEMLLALAPTPWQPLSARPKSKDPMPARLRAVLLGAVAIAHLLAIFGLMALLERRQRASDEEAILVDFIDEPTPTVIELPPAPNETVTIRMPKPAMKRERAAPASAPVREAPASPVDVPLHAAENPPKEKLQLFNPDGSLRTPEHMLDKLDEKFGDKRTFSWQHPHMDDAKKYFDRNPALVYEKTRFDDAWAPDHDALTALLEKAVEKTTKEVKVKVPGMGGSSHVVCTISFLALTGSCRVQTNGADWNGPQDDPDTLNPQEERECAAWWQKIIDAKTQDAWRATKKLYEANCRKPLAKRASG